MVSVLPTSNQRLHFCSEVEVRWGREGAGRHVSGQTGARAAGGPAPPLHPVACVFQVLRYFDYVFTGVFTFEMVIKVKASREHPGFRVWMGLLSAPLAQCPSQCSPPLGRDSPGEASAAPSSGLGLR